MELSNRHIMALGEMRRRNVIARSTTEHEGIRKGEIEKCIEYKKIQSIA